MWVIFAVMFNCSMIQLVLTEATKGFHQGLCVQERHHTDWMVIEPQELLPSENWTEAIFPWRILYHS